ncbi:MAG TPA: YdeI/OmpD-associated family protein [Polyangia bacterium]
MKPTVPILAFASARSLDQWLARNHSSSTGVWLKLAKKGAAVASVTYAEAIEVALTWGWIDGQKQAHDASHWLQKLTPRGARSLWSKINRDKASALIAAGKMQPRGLAEVERARRDGRWERAYDGPSRSTVPDDLSAALDRNARAKKRFATLDAANRYAILWRVQTAKKPETRARRIADLVAMLARGELLHPERRKKASRSR